MKALLTIVALLSMTSCQLIEDTYQYDSFSSIHVYSKGNTELFLEFYTLDSMNWISRAAVSEAEGKLKIKVYYTPVEKQSDFIRNEEGNFICKVYESDTLDGKVVFYEDRNGLHPIEIEEWEEDLLNPYVAPKMTDPFEHKN